MALVKKIDSNFTELRFAVEQTPGVLPGSPVWIPAEPNEYKDFGAELITKARTPINASRQRKKGVPIDLNATAGYIQDVTASNSQTLLEGFMFAATRTKAVVNVATVDGTNEDYEPASGGTGFSINDLLIAEGFAAAANNGLKQVSAHPTVTSVTVNSNLTTAAGQSGTITRVGTQFPSGFASIDATVGDYPKLVITGNVAATGLLTFAANVANNDTVTIGTPGPNQKTYTFKTALTPAVNEVLIGALAADSRNNLVAAITGGAGSGTLYGAGTVAHTEVTAAANGANMDVTALRSGLSGNNITTTEVSANLSFGAATLTGGAGKDLRNLGVIPGEFVWLGGDLTAEKFASAVNNGFARVREVTDGNTIVFDKTQNIMVDDNGAAKTIRLFYGHVLKNEVDQSLIVKKTFQFERTLGAPDDSLPAAIQAEYVTNSLANEAVLDAQTAEFLLLDMQMLSGDVEQRTAAQGLKSGTRPTLTETDAFNTTNDVTLIKMAAVSTTDSCPTALFAFLTDLKVTINNNAQQNKALGVFGSFDVTAGTFEVTAEVTAYFQTVEAITLARNNASVTLEAHFVKENKGLSLDLPLITLAKVQPDVELDEPVLLPLESDAATAKLIDPDLDYTLMWTFWPYLPDAAE